MVTPVPTSRAAWISLIGCLTVTLLLYQSTVASTYALWSQNPLSLGYLVVPAVSYLIWTRRDHLKNLVPAPSYWALPWLGLATLVWLVGNLTGTDIVQQLALIAIVIGFVWAIAGAAVLGALLFPLVFLVFALQLGDRFIPVLQDMTARFAVKLLQTSGVPVLLEGHVISIPGGRWQVADACSGINYLTSSLAVGYLYAGLVYRRWSHRIGFVLASAILPLVANGVRVYATIFIASLGATGIASGMEHYIFGYVVFAAILWLLLVTCGRWLEDEVSNPSDQFTRADPSPSASARRTSTLFAAACATVLVAAAPVASRMLFHSHGLGTSGQLQVAKPWTAIPGDAFGWKPRFNAPSDEAIQSFTANGKKVTAYMASYSSQQPGIKLASATNLLFLDPWWETQDSVRTIDVHNRRERVRETVLRSPQSSLVLWSWYWVDGRMVSDDYLAKLLLAKSRLLRSADGAVAIVIATDGQSTSDAADILTAFIAEMSWTAPSEP